MSGAFCRVWAVSLVRMSEEQASRSLDPRSEQVRATGLV